MAFFVQHGYGKSDKITRGIQAGHLQGVIMSPRDEDPVNLQSYVASLRQEFSNIPIIFDTQFYVTTVSPVKEGNLSSYPYYHAGLTRGDFIAPADIGRYIRESIDYQMQLPLSYLVSPTVLFDDFQDPWSQIALSMAQESIAYQANLRGAPPLLISLVFSETALRSADRMGEFLDIISVFQAAGFYIILRRSNDHYTTQMDSSTLQNLLYMTYALAELNSFEVIYGYTDIMGILLHVVGAAATACGWFNSLRQFSLSRFQPSTGGRPARDRYTSIPLLNSILVIPELDSIYRSGLIDEVLTATSYDGILRTDPANAPWTKDISYLHHWNAVQQAIGQVATGTIGQRLNSMLEMIARARAIYARLEQGAVAFEPYSNSAHLEQWQRAIQNFRTDTSI
ncbi:MAG: hypothetical protein PHS93_05155 [Candidatus Omnitrophica bacterium]|nr:hypothetical protein [Candidatus Omnitrophota bacterium]MDD5352541.1 hypothetical protein [Candidatus Omnitrophota bacterium]MDD5550139.1 hypothetical protein [Candidatus Omnitrophota bacterium]